MMSLSRVVVLAALAGLSPVSAMAQQSAKSGDTSTYVQELRDTVRKLDEVRRMPVNGMSIIRTGDNVFFVSDNGRFLIKGKAYDLWTRQEIARPSDMDKTEKVSFGQIGLKPADMFHLAYGTGKHEVSIFLDPYCAHCHSLLAQLPALAKDYTFRLYVIPVLGQRSTEAARQLACAKDPSRGFVALVERKIHELPQKDDCSKDALSKTIIAAQMLGVPAVPYTIAPDGTVAQGSVKDFRAFLQKTVVKGGA